MGSWTSEFLKIKQESPEMMGDETSGQTARFPAAHYTSLHMSFAVSSGGLGWVPWIQGWSVGVEVAYRGLER